MGASFSHAADAQIRPIQIRHKCQGMSLLMPLSRSKNQFLAAAGPGPPTSPVLGRWGGDPREAPAERDRKDRRSVARRKNRTER
jgi:hypothetical protein